MSSRALPLRWRLVLWTTASLGLILLLFAGALYVQTRRALLAQLDAGLDIVATQASLGVRARDGRLAFGEVETNPTIAGRLADDFLVINLLGPDGAVWDHHGETAEFPAAATEGYATVDAAGEPWRVYTHAVASGGVSGAVQVIQDMDAVNESLAALRRQMLLALPLALVAAGLGGYAIASRALRPIAQLSDAARAVTADSLGRRIDYRGPADEVGELAATLDDMLARLEAGFERERRFAADAAHELRTPLAALKGRIGVTLSRSRAPAAYVEALAEMDGQVDRLIRLSNDLLLMARLGAEEGKPSDPVSLAALLPVVADVLRPLADAGGIALEVDAAGAPIVRGREDLLARLFLNLLDNAIRHTPPGGRVTLAAARDGDEAVVIVRDTGPGVADDHLPHLFERFYRVEDGRARDGEGGAGLGLALADEIARAHGARLAASSAPGEGATFEVRFPPVT